MHPPHPDLDYSTLEPLLGQVMLDVYQENDTIVFCRDDNEVWALEHSQNCCEHVYVEDVVGDLADLEGSPLTMAEEATRDGSNEDGAPDTSVTWTYYRFATAKGYVTIRFCGSSNGYYSERVDLVRRDS